MTGKIAAGKRILVIRLSAIGDVAFASGLIRSLRQAQPDGFLAWLVEPAGADLLRHNRGLDELIIWPKNNWKALWRERRYRALGKALGDFRRLLSGHRFDQVIDTQGLMKSALLAHLSGAGQRIALQPREGSAWLCHHRIEPPAGDRRIGAEYRYLAEMITGEHHYRMDIAIGDNALATIDQRLAADTHGRPIALLCPMTTRAQKHWVDQRWTTLATRLLDHGLQPILLGGPEPSALRRADRISAAEPALFNWVGATRLDEAVALLSRARVLIGVDTGLTHLGIALGCPTVALFGSSRPYLNPMSDRAAVLYEPRECSPCHRRPTCEGRFDCMAAHRVEQVLEHALRLIDE